MLCLVKDIFQISFGFSDMVKILTAASGPERDGENAFSRLPLHPMGRGGDPFRPSSCLPVSSPFLFLLSLASLLFVSLGLRPI